MSNLREKIFRRLIENYPIQAARIEELLAPTIGIEVTSSNSRSTEKPSSKFGGYPEVPVNFEWPNNDGKKLTFFCQINLEELERLVSFPALPEKGMLYFFMLTKGINRYPEYKNEFCIIYSENIEVLRVYSDKLDVQVFNEAYLNFHEHYTLPTYQSYLLRDEIADISNVIADFKDEMYELIGYESDYYNQMLGHPQSVQNDVAYEWAFKILGFSSHDLNHSEKKTLKKLESLYVNLLQIDFANSGTNFSEYGGDGVAYFGIEREDLMNRNFKNSSLIIQST